MQSLECGVRSIAKQLQWGAHHVQVLQGLPVQFAASHNLLELNQVWMIALL